MKRLPSFAAVALTTLCTFTGALLAADPIKLPAYGFQIDPLEVPAGSPAQGQAIALFLPPVGKFAPNVNVGIQPYAGTIAEYVTLSHSQFTALKAKVISEKQTGEKEWSVEYAAEMQGNSLHWYARAISQGGKVYLITATAMEANWGDSSPALKKCVDSFKLQ